MLNAADLQAVRQVRINALATKNLHQGRVDSLRRLSVISDAFVLVVALLYVPVRYLAKGTPHGETVESIWELAGAVLIVVSVLKLAFSWQSRVEKHAVCLGRNISLAGDADRL